jgi:hypothetical protein
LPGGDEEFEIVFAGEPAPFTVPYTAGTTLDFTQYVPGGVASFYLTGIDPAEAIQPDELNPFVSGLQFANNGSAEVRFIPWNAVAIVPEPGGMALLAMGFMLTGCGRNSTRRS